MGVWWLGGRGPQTPEVHFHVKVRFHAVVDHVTYGQGNVNHPTGGRDLTATAVTSSKIVIAAVALMVMDMAVVVVRQSLKYVPLFRNNWPAHVLLLTI